MDNETSTSTKDSISGYNGESKQLIIDLEDFCIKKAQQDLDQKNKENQNEIEKKPNFFCCKNLHYYIPLLVFSANLIEIFCKCRNEKLSYEEVNQQLLSNEDKIIKDDCYKCQKSGHKNKKYVYYCSKCKSEKFLCKFCKKDGLCQHNDIKAFDIDGPKIAEWESEIKIKIKESDIDINLRKIIEIILNNYNSNPSIVYFPIIESIKNFLSENPSSKL